MSSISFSADGYGPEVAALLAVPRLPELGPGTADKAAFEQLSSLTVERLCRHPAVKQTEQAKCCLAGLWLRFDYLEESHSISQSIPSSTGSYWHGIMHRREPDYSNAKYWFRRVGQHPIFEPLAEFVRQLPSESPVVPQLSSGDWDPYRFVDVCKQAYQTNTEDEIICRKIAQAEWQLLFAQ